MRGDDFFPVALPVGFPLRQQNDAEFVLKFFQQDFDRSADFGKVFLVLPLVALDDAFAFVTDVDDHLVFVDANDGPLHDFVDFVSFGPLFVNFIHLSRAGDIEPFQPPLDLLIEFIVSN